MMTTRRAPAAKLFFPALALALVACAKARPIADGAGGDLEACAVCHGDPTREGDPLVRAAPPASTCGGDGGAHLAHLSAGSFRAPLACAECHDVPTLADHEDGVVGLRMPGLATADGASPSWNAGSATCSGVYCHGATLGGGPAATPAWSSTADLDCTSCHGAPPPAPHPVGTSCGACHTGYTPSSVNAATHIDGTVEWSNPHPAGYLAPTAHGYDVNRSGLASCKACHGTDLTSCNGCHGGTAWQTSCTFCHGTSPSGAASPPVDTQGRSAATNVSVGAHASHVETTIASPIACTACHPDRTGSNVVTDGAHVDGDGIAEVEFATGTLARTGGAPAAYTRVSDTSATCESTYCHGQFTGGTAATVSWTSTTQVTCTSCHGNPPDTGDHARHASATVPIACYNCHNAVVNAAGGIVNATLHVNGTDDVKFGGTYYTRDGGPVTGTWNASTRQCSNNCHYYDGAMNW